MKKLFWLFILSIIFSPFNVSANSLAGRILLQVEKNGEAYYYHPDKLELFYLGRPSDAFNIMREEGIGISNNDLLKIPVADTQSLKETFKNIYSDNDSYSDYTELIEAYNPYGAGILSYDLNFTSKNAGKIFLQVENNGEAWYVSPVDLKRYFLGRPSDAFEIMRTLGLGISNQDLESIGLEEKIVKEYTWRYDNLEYNLSYQLSDEVFKLYNQDPKVLTYYQDNIPTDLRTAYYQMFFDLKSEDNYTLSFLEKLKLLATDYAYQGDSQLEFILAFIQYLNYDFDKAKESEPKANFPYETLYLQQGICTDTSFLAYQYAKELAYGVAILDFPDSNHAALGLKCPVDISLNNSGYCFVETTNYFPLGMVPSSLNNGQANIDSLEDDLFSADNLGAMEIRLAIDGQTYQQVEDNMETANDLKVKQERIKELKELIDEDNTLNKEEIISEHNDLVTIYNQLLKSFYQISVIE